ncbi:DUF3769 domain-containing protein [Planktothrix agardhii]|uniref:DUF3769 domain-containing protein n=2 Tax=Planktothrix agardhii TaxID=1160 RepID=UPI000486F9EE
MPYPLPPPDLPPMIRHLPQPQTTETGIIGLEPQISSRVKTPRTISYPLPEDQIQASDPVSAELLGSAVTIETAPPLTENQYRFDASFSFTNSDNSCQSPCNRIVVTPPKTPTQESTVIPVPTPADIVEITADRQEYDQQRQIVTAQGNVMVRFRQSLINAEQAQVNLNTRQVIAQGNVALTRGNQVIRGDRMDYNFVVGTGSVYQANGVVYTPSADTDLTVVDPLTPGVTPLLNAPISDRITAAQPLAKVKADGGLNAGVSVGGGETFGVKGSVNRLRFAAERIDLFGDGGWEAQQVRLTNDPFSPPELELRADTARFNRVSPLRDELITTKSRLVLDQSFNLPLFRERTVIDRTQKEPLPFSFGYDLKDFGGYYIQGNLPSIPLGPLNLQVAPRLLLQRAFQENITPFDPKALGLEAKISGSITPTTELSGFLSINTLENFPDLNEKALRSSIRVRQQLGAGFALNGEYSYRNRLFNGTLGYRTVWSSLGTVLTSPKIRLNEQGATFSFQTSYQSVTADSDRPELLKLNRLNNRVTLDRYEALGTLIYPVLLWRGEGLPATATEGLRYTPRPVIPFVQLALITRGVTTQYSQDYSQSYLSTSVGVQGQLGHFSKDFLDYTGFSLFYTQVILDGQSPFLFDRLVDQRVLSMGLVQQIYGGLRAGIESAVNLDNGLSLNNELTLEYSRRTYGVILRINPVRRIGSINLRISDFNWIGTPDPYFGSAPKIEN